MGLRWQLRLSRCLRPPGSRWHRTVSPRWRAQARPGLTAELAKQSEEGLGLAVLPGAATFELRSGQSPSPSQPQVSVLPRLSLFGGLSVTSLRAGGTGLAQMYARGAAAALTVAECRALSCLRCGRCPSQGDRQTRQPQICTPGRRFPWVGRAFTEVGGGRLCWALCWWRLALWSWPGGAHLDSLRTSRLPGD